MTKTWVYKLVLLHLLWCQYCVPWFTRVVYKLVLLHLLWCQYYVPWFTRVVCLAQYTYLGARQAQFLV